MLSIWGFSTQFDTGFKIAASRSSSDQVDSLAFWEPWTSVNFLGSCACMGARVLQIQLFLQFISLFMDCILEQWFRMFCYLPCMLLVSLYLCSVSKDSSSNQVQGMAPQLRMLRSITHGQDLRQRTGGFGQWVPDDLEPQIAWVQLASMFAKPRGVLVCGEKTLH